MIEWLERSTWKNHALRTLRRIVWRPRSIIINPTEHLIRLEVDTLSCAKFRETAYSFPAREALCLLPSVYREKFRTRDKLSAGNYSNIWTRRMAITLLPLYVSAHSMHRAFHQFHLLIVSIIIYRPNVKYNFLLVIFVLLIYMYISSYRYCKIL